MAVATFLGPDLDNAMLAIAFVHIPNTNRMGEGQRSGAGVPSRDGRLSGPTPQP